MNATPLQWVAAAVFALAILHTFCIVLLRRLWRPLGEVEVAFVLWAVVLLLAIALLQGSAAATGYVASLRFTEPAFVFVSVLVAGTTPVLQAALVCLRLIARALPLSPAVALYFTVMLLAPLLGSLITEPAAMTLAALLLGERFLSGNASARLQYGTLGVLFVNVSLGGTLTAFAAPPVLMVAERWGWDNAFMLSTFGWKAALAVALNAAGMTWLCRDELHGARPPPPVDAAPVPVLLVIVQLALLALVVINAHNPSMFPVLLLLQAVLVVVCRRHYPRLMWHEALLVSGFLAALVLLGGQQRWWLQPLLASMDSGTVFYGAAVLTAVVDNAALTYLGSLVDGLSDAFKYALVAGAVVGGGLTLIANAPNPAGAAILRRHFTGAAIHPLRLLLAALPPTVVAALVFRLP